MRPFVAQNRHWVLQVEIRSPSEFTGEFAPAMGASAAFLALAMPAFQQWHSRSYACQFFALCVVTADAIIESINEAKGPAWWMDGASSTTTHRL